MTTPTHSRPVRGVVTHHLKTLPLWFDLAERGLKPWEIRMHDRDYQPGDMVSLREWSPHDGYTERTLDREILFVFHGGTYGLDGDHCILSLAPVAPTKDPRHDP